MKRFILTAIAAICMTMAFSVSGFAATENYVSNDMPVKAEAELTGAYAPRLTIKKSSDHRAGEKIRFDLNLTNAEWLYEGTGAIKDTNGNDIIGITYTVLTSRSMIIEVDNDEFNPSEKDITIPLETRIDDIGTADVTIDPRGSTVSAGTYTFAHVSFPGMGIQLSNVDTKKGSFDLGFTDNYPYAMARGRIFKLTLNNGFIFLSADEVEGSGKYSDYADFKIDSKNKSIAYVEIKEYTSNSVGSIKIKGIKTATTDNTEKKTTTLYVEPVYGEGGAVSFNLGFLESEENMKTGTPVLFTIGKNGYVVEENEVESDAAPYIDTNGRTMLPLRALANAFNISDEDIKWDDYTKTVTLINKEGKVVTITVGSTQLKVGSARVTMDTTAVIKNERTYLPMRAVLNALGIKDDDIIWNDTDKTVLVYNK